MTDQLDLVKGLKKEKSVNGFGMNRLVPIKKDSSNTSSEWQRKLLSLPTQLATQTYEACQMVAYR